jgi:hypothetical protein
MQTHPRIVWPATKRGTGEEEPQFNYVHQPQYKNTQTHTSPAEKAAKT